MPDRRMMASSSCGAVVVEAGDEAEAVPQGPGHQPGAGGGTHQGEARQVEPDGAGAGSLAEDDVQLEVLHGRVQDLLDGSAQAMDLVHEEHVAFDQVGQDGGQVAGPHQGRPGGDPEAGAHLVGDDPGQRGLPQARWTSEEEVVDGLGPAPGRLQHDLQMFLAVRPAPRTPPGGGAAR